MKVAELFASLGFKIEGEEELTRLEKSLEGIATAARNAALALKDLAAARIPKAITVRQGTPPATNTPPVPSNPSLANPIPTSNPNFIGPVKPPPYTGPTPPKIQPMPNAVLQGLKSLGMLALKVGGIATVALALKKLVSALMDMVRVSMQATFAVDKFTSQTGLSRRELKEWERIAALSDIKAEALQETLKGLQQRSRNIRWTGEGATPFLQLGINAMASPSEIMKQFAERTKQMDQATAVFWGNQIGISEEMVYMLRKNGDKLKDLIPDAQLDNDQFKNITELNAAWKELTFNLGALKDKITSDLSPAIKWVVEQIDNWVKIMTVSKPVRDWVLRGGPTNPAAAIPMIRGVMQQMHQTKVENNIDVNVSGSDKPKETARETATAVGRAVSDAYYQQFPANAAL